MLEKWNFCQEFLYVTLELNLKKIYISSLLSLLFFFLNLFENRLSRIRLLSINYLDSFCDLSNANIFSFYGLYLFWDFNFLVRNYYGSGSKDQNYSYKPQGPKLKAYIKWVK